MVATGQNYRDNEEIEDNFGMKRPKMKWTSQSGWIIKSLYH